MAKSRKKESAGAPVEAPGLTPLPDAPSEGEGNAPSMTEAFVPLRLRATRLWAAWMAWPWERRLVLGAMTIAAVVFIPWLGAVGLWDPWEPHYAEVAREMIVRGDYVHPYWEHAYFFSKPVFSMWMMAFGMNLVDALHGPAGAMSIWTEWAVRLPFALLATLGVVSVALASARIFGRRVGLIAAFALATMPFYFLIARQAMTDMPLVSLMTAALASFMIAVFGRSGDDEAPRAGWLYAFYVFVGLATLAKGALGFALPGLVIFVWMVITNEWRLLLRLRIPTGALVFLAVAAPWYTAMFLFDGKDDEFKTFFVRFIIHDHLNRLGSGVHTTTPGGTFVYFIEQLGFGIFPWVFAVPGAFAYAARTASPERRSMRERAVFFVLVWAVATWLLFSMSATKFHHYGFPVVPPLAILVALYVDALWEEGVTPRHLVLLLMGLALFVVVAQNLVLQPKHLTDLFVYNYERPYPHREVDPRVLFGTIFSLAGAGLAVGYLWRSRKGVVGSLFTIAAVFAIYTSWVHWKELSFHWSQRDLFWTYYHDRKDDEPIAAYYMNWRGETFYSQNSVVQIKDANTLREFVARPGPEYVLVEQGRYKGMRSVLGRRYKPRILDRSNNKFYLVRVDDAAPAGGSSG